MNKSKRDDIFLTDSSNSFSEDVKPPQFSFNETVASVFDDMISRSIPGYEAVQDLTADLALGLNIKSNENIIDIGCSTGTSIIKIAERIKLNAEQEMPQFIGIDNSLPMLKRCQEKLEAYGLENAVKLKNEDIQNSQLEKSKLIICHYTLQFIDPDSRPNALKRIYSSLSSGGFLIFSEKVKHENQVFEEIITKSYYSFKSRNGYSDTETMRKRAALENFLRPFTLQDNLQLLRDAGFSELDVVNKELCFATIIAKK